MNGDPCVKKNESEFEIILRTFASALDRYNDLNNRVEQAVVRLKDFRNPVPEPSEKSCEPIGVIPTLQSMINGLNRMNDRLEKTIGGLSDYV